jgi:uncharacterized membrane protein YkgB
MSDFEDQIVRRHLNDVDQKITAWMASNGVRLLEFALGVIFLWFGFIKIFPGLSPEEILVKRTLPFFNPSLVMPSLAVVESMIGLGLIFNRFKRLTLLLLFGQMGGTVVPLIMLPDVVWHQFPYALTLEGQYIVKNLVLIGSGLVIGATVRGGKITTT